MFFWKMFNYFNFIMIENGYYLLKVGYNIDCYKYFICNEIVVFINCFLNVLLMVIGIVGNLLVLVVIYIIFLLCLIVFVFFFGSLVVLDFLVGFVV